MHPLGVYVVRVAQLVDAGLPMQQSGLNSWNTLLAIGLQQATYRPVAHLLELGCKEIGHGGSRMQKNTGGSAFRSRLALIW